MSTIRCRKDFSITVNPDPTFQGLLWKIISSSGSPTFVGNKERFTLNVVLGPSSNETFHANGGDGTAGGQILVPATVKQRNCKLHLDVALTGLNYNLIPGTCQIQFVYNQLAPFAANSITLGVPPLNTPGSYDYAFTLNPGKAYNINLTIDQQTQVFAGAGNFLNLTWNAFLYVETYS